MTDKKYMITIEGLDLKEAGYIADLFRNPLKSIFSSTNTVKVYKDPKFHEFEDENREIPVEAEIGYRPMCKHCGGFAEDLIHTMLKRRYL